MKFCHQLLSLTTYLLLAILILIDLLDPTATENDFIKYCLIPLINMRGISNANNNPSILDDIWSNQLYDTFNGIFLLDITDHYPIFTIVPIN